MLACSCPAKIPCVIRNSRSESRNVSRTSDHTTPGEIPWTGLLNSGLATAGLQPIGDNVGATRFSSVFSYPTVKWPFCPRISSLIISKVYSASFTTVNILSILLDRYLYPASIHRRPKSCPFSDWTLLRTSLPSASISTIEHPRIE